MAVDVLIVHSIPRGSFVAIPGVPEAERNALRADLEAAAGHKEFAVVWLADGAAVGVLDPGEVSDAIKASMGDEVRDELINETRIVAREEAKDAIDHGRVPPVVETGEGPKAVGGGPTKASGATKRPGGSTR